MCQLLLSCISQFLKQLTYESELLIPKIIQIIHIIHGDGITKNSNHGIGRRHAVATAGPLMPHDRDTHGTKAGPAKKHGPAQAPRMAIQDSGPACVIVKRVKSMQKMVNLFIFSTDNTEFLVIFFAFIRSVFPHTIDCISCTLGTIICADHTSADRTCDW